MAKIRIYGTNTCAWCGAARMLLKRKGLDFEDILVHADPEKRAEMVALSGRRSVPQIVIGERSIGGYEELAALDKNGELDQLLAAG